MAPIFPTDVLFLICTQLSSDKDFDTLFQCALVSKDFALAALPNLYRMHDVAPVTSHGSKQADIEDNPVTFAKWSLLWRSLIQSSVGATYQPYLRFMRALDLRDLRQLLETLSDSVGPDGQRLLFDGAAREFWIRAKNPPRFSTKRGSKPLNVVAILEKVGDAFTTQTPMLEELSGEVSNEALLRWLPRLPKLQQLWFWDGSIVKGAGSSLAAHCPYFRSLTMYLWSAADADVELASFLGDLKPHTLESLHIFSTSQVGEKVVDALSSHSQRLRFLDVGQAQSMALITSLPTLEACPNLTTLHLDNIHAPLPNEVTKTLSEWLIQCSSIRDLAIKNTENAPLILIPFISHPTTRLTRLEVARYNGPMTNEFHAALGHQANSLTALLLTADGETCDAPTLARSLASLHFLTELRLTGVSDFFGTVDLGGLCEHVRGLEELMVSGWAIEDSIWTLFRKLTALRRLDFNAFAAPSFEALYAFVDQLGAPGTRGLFLSVNMADPSTPLSEEEQAALGRLIDERVGGRFEYALARGMDYSFREIRALCLQLRRKAQARLGRLQVLRDLGLLPLEDPD